MIYIMQNKDKVEFRSGDMPFPEGAIYPIPKWVRSVPDNELKIVNGILMHKSVEEVEAEEKAIKEAEALAIIQAEEDFQNNKSDTLKSLENIYIDFLENMWTPALVKLGLIPPDFVIRVTNTDEPTNMSLLMQMRIINFSTYETMAGEFDRLKMAIISNGGIMSKITSH